MSHALAVRARAAVCALLWVCACGGKDTVGMDQPNGGSKGGASGTASSGQGGSRSDAGGAQTGSSTSSDAGSKSDAGSSRGTAGSSGNDGPRDGGMASGDGGGTASPATAEDPACDMNGVWIGRFTSFNRDNVFQAVQTASAWYYWVIEQRGRTLTIQTALDCGIQVSGSADVTINRATTQALLHANDRKGLHGQFYKQGDQCVLTIDRFYAVRGVSRATYLPADTSSNPDLASILPALPTETMPQGNEDWDMDGHPGIAFNVTNLGSRHVVQRDWNEFYSDDKRPVALSSDMITIHGRFDNQEDILETTGGLGGLLRAGSMPATGLDHRLVLQRIGRDETEASVKMVRDADDLTTCYNVQAALPHDPASM